MIFDWAKKMRFMIVGGILLVLLVIGASIAFLTLYRAPSCIDGKQNQQESGIDCGGSCTYLCTTQVSAPSVLFTRSLPLPGGRTDVVAYVQNPNKNAQAKRAPYVIELFAPDATRIGRVDGFVDLPAGKMVPIFVRAAAQGSVVARAFIQFDERKIPWTSVKGVYLTPRVTEQQLQEGGSPRVTATLVNDTYDPQYDIRAVAVAFTADGTAVAASETLVPVVRAQSTVPITFTWNEPFTDSVSRFEVLPTSPLP